VRQSSSFSRPLPRSAANQPMRAYDPGQQDAGGTSLLAVRSVAASKYLVVNEGFGALLFASTNRTAKFKNRTGNQSMHMPVRRRLLALVGGSP